MRGSEEVYAKPVLKDEGNATVGALSARNRPNAEEVIAGAILEWECVKLAEQYLGVDGVEEVRKVCNGARD
jgi:hypothetical protein